MSYEPKPIDTRGVTLPDDICRLTELLARNAHDVWASQHINDGWTHDTIRDDAAKTHPCLLAYEELPESEKQYDRHTAMETLKAIQMLGYSIEHRQEIASASDPNYSGTEDLSALCRLLDGPPKAQSSDVMAFWLAHDRSRWCGTPEIYRLIGDWLLQNGDPLLAHDVVSEGLQQVKDDPRLRQLQGLALVRTGAAAMANEVLGRLRDEGHADEETLGILARTYKDLGLRASGAERLADLGKARDLYDEAHLRNRGAYWTGINAASLTLLLGDQDRARSLATTVEQECAEALKKARNEGADTYWILATLGEAALVQNERTKALDWYGQAVEVSDRRWGDVSSTRRQARLLLERLDGDRDAFERCLRIPPVVVFAGHMIDQPDRAHPRFPAALETAVKESIRNRLHEMNAGFGYSSCAMGSDILFQESLKELRGETHVVLPYPPEDFIHDSVGAGTEWESRFRTVHQHTTERLVASSYRLTWGGVTYDYTNLLLLGRALLHADHLQTDLIPLAVWDGNAGDGPGGTASIVERWRRLGHTIELVNIAGILASHGYVSVANPHAGLRMLLPLPASASPPLMPEVKAILCADVREFGKLTEEQIVIFSKQVLKMIGEITTRSLHAPRVRNTWGDGLFCVFDTVEDAALYALELRDRMRKTDWSRHGLPATLALRTALHAGPIFQYLDPVTTQPNYLGMHVNYAARIEPITPAGEIYASWAFAAHARAEQLRGFACDYAGKFMAPKLADPVTAYRMRRV